MGAQLSPGRVCVGFIVLFGRLMTGVCGGTLFPGGGGVVVVVVRIDGLLRHKDCVVHVRVQCTVQGV